MQMMKRVVCVAVALLVVANVCRAEESLADKLAKLETASKTRQATPKNTVKLAVKENSITDILSGKVKTLAERLEEMDVLHKSLQETDKSLDSRLVALERELETSRTETRIEAQKSHDALSAKLAELDKKVQGLQAQARAAVMKETPAAAAEKAGEESDEPGKAGAAEESESTAAAADDVEPPSEKKSQAEQREESQE